MKKRIVVITDCADVAANEIRAVLVSELDKIGADQVEIEPMVFAKQFSIIHGNFLARLIADNYDPESLTILAIINPLDTSNSQRARLAIRLKNGIKLVGANTGIFSWLVDDFGIDIIVETNSKGLKGDNFIPFGGKYIHAPIASRLAALDDINSVKENSFHERNFFSQTFTKGTVVHIDNFGVSKLLINSDSFTAQQGDKFTLKIKGKIIGKAVYCHSMKELQDGQLAIYKGSSLGLVEVGVVREYDGAERLGLAIGDCLEVVSETEAVQ